MPDNLENLIVIDNFQEGISNYNGNFERLVNCNISDVEGSLLVNTRTTDISAISNDVYAPVTFTVDTGNDYIISTGWGDKAFDGQSVTFTTTDTLPAGLSTGTTYYVKVVDSNNVKVSTTINNLDSETYVDITDSGTGTHTMTATQMKFVTKFLRNPDVSGGNYRYYALDSDQQVWVKYGDGWCHLDGNTSGNGQGMEIYRDYLFVFDSTAIDVYGPLSDVGDTASWTTSWQTITSDADHHPSLVGQDDRVYIGGGNIVSSFYEKSGQTFDPGTSATYTYSANVLDLPEGYRIKCMAELGKNLMIGTWKGANVFDLKIADIFPWDRVSPSFNIPIRFEENGINAMINIRNVLYIIAGHDGNIYASDGTSSVFYKKLPTSFFHNINNYSLLFYPNAIMSHDGRLFFGVSSFTAGNTALYPLGIMSLDLDTKVLNFENTISSGNDGNGNYVRIGAMISVDSNYYYYSWLDNSQTYKTGIDYNFENRYVYNNNQAYLETGLYKIGHKDYKTEIKQIEIILDQELPFGTDITIAYRENLSDSYTTIDTLSYSTHGSVNNYVFKPSGLNFSTVQFKVSFISSSVLDRQTSPRLNQIIVRGYKKV